MENMSSAEHLGYEQEDAKAMVEDEATTPTTDPGDLNDLGNVSDCGDSDSGGSDGAGDQADDMEMDYNGDDEFGESSAPSQMPRQLSKPPPPPRSPAGPQYFDTLLLFDWDDTLFPTTYIHNQGLTLNGPDPTDEHWPSLQVLSASAGRILRAAKKRGCVVLVTNSERGWVEFSCRKFTPWLLPDLEDVKVVSARSEYEQDNLASPFKWKQLAFENEMTNFENKLNSWDTSGRYSLNVLSIGDSGHERHALLRAAKCFPTCRAKSVKFVERPGPKELLKQHELLGQCLRQICSHEGCLDLNFKLS